jgi:hypothetical protein
MTVYFELDGIAFLVNGVKHDKRFEAHSIHVMGYGADCRALFNDRALERIEEAAAEAADEPEAPVEDVSSEATAPTVAVVDVDAKRLIHLSVELAKEGGAK